MRPSLVWNGLSFRLRRCYITRPFKSCRTLLTRANYTVHFHLNDFSYVVALSWELASYGCGVAVGSCHHVSPG